MSKTRTAPHTDAVDRMYIVSGLDIVCSMLLSLPEKVQQYTDALKKEKTDGVA